MPVNGYPIRTTLSVNIRDDRRAQLMSSSEIMLVYHELNRAAWCTVIPCSSAGVAGQTQLDHVENNVIV